MGLCEYWGCEQGITLTVNRATQASMKVVVADPNSPTVACLAMRDRISDIDRRRHKHNHARSRRLQDSVWRRLKRYLQEGARGPTWSQDMLGRDGRACAPPSNPGEKMRPTDCDIRKCCPRLGAGVVTKNFWLGSRKCSRDLAVPQSAAMGIGR